VPLLLVATTVTLLLLIFFFFQAEDGIRDLYVTGVQTCALPILRARRAGRGVEHARGGVADRDEGQRIDDRGRDQRRAPEPQEQRSEERRVGKECRSRWTP